MSFSKCLVIRRPTSTDLSAIMCLFLFVFLNETFFCQHPILPFLSPFPFFVAAHCVNQGVGQGETFQIHVVAAAFGLLKTMLNANNKTPNSL